jgi:hypothetical protein
MHPLATAGKQLSVSNQYRQAFEFYERFHFSADTAPNCFDVENGPDKNDEFPVYDGCSDIGIEDMNEIAEHLILQEHTAFFAQSVKFYNEAFAPLNHHRLSVLVKLPLMLLVFPLSVFCLLKQMRTFVVIAVFNYTGVNLRTTFLLNVETERDIMLKDEQFKDKPLTLDKTFYLAEKYMTYWVAVIILAAMGPFVNSTNIFQIYDGYQFVQDNNRLNYLVQIAISAVIGFANLIPSRALRPDISSFISSFTEDDYTIRDSCHTRLKDLSEILADIKRHGFALFSTEINTPIIVSTKAPEELAVMPGFTALLRTSTFDNNQILRFIQIEEDVDTFFVLRNDISMCHRVEYESRQWSDILRVLREEHRLSFGLDVTAQDLEIFRGATLVLMVGLIVSVESVNVTAALLSWVTWPIAAAVLFRRRRSMLASVNFFTLDGRDRKYQPFNNICVANDDVILTKICSFSFFCALSRYTLQEKYLVHTLLKITESVQYDWLNCGLTVRDFKHLASLAAITYEKDVGVITPHARMYYSAPRRHNDICVVCVISVKGEVNSVQMTRVQFAKATKSLPDGEDTSRVENLLLR